MFTIKKGMTVFDKLNNIGYVTKADAKTILVKWVNKSDPDNVVEYNQTQLNHTIFLTKRKQK